MLCCASLPPVPPNPPTPHVQGISPSFYQRLFLHVNRWCQWFLTFQPLSPIPPTPPVQGVCHLLWPFKHGLCAFWCTALYAFVITLIICRKEMGISEQSLRRRGSLLARCKPTLPSTRWKCCILSSQLSSRFSCSVSWTSWVTPLLG